MKSYEYKDNGGRNLCKQHHMLRCSECFYVDVLERENKRYREAIEQMLKLSRKQDHYLPVSYLVRLYEIGNEALGVESKCPSKN
ncbi:hypothetical protein K0H71_15095 [Bacillus sp. IITD106]|nr:hypothetical protein [Bacillus sp. IITD106]